MFRAIQHYWARLYVGTIVGLVTGVERKADVLCLQVPPRE
jgi:hypothetical protein